MSLYKWGWCVWKDVDWAEYIESSYLCMISYSVSSCVVHIKYCNHLLAADMAGVACRGLWCACCWNSSLAF